MNVKKCADCPVVSVILAAAEELDETARIKSEVALDVSFDEISQEIFSRLPKGLTPVDTRRMTQINEPNELADSLRELAVDQIDALHSMADAERKDVQTLTNECLDGPLKMRATKAGRIITVTVCGSALAPDGVSKKEPVTIRRD